MKLKLSTCWQWDGQVDRGEYLAWGTMLLAIKYGVDCLVAAWFFHRYWSPWNYVFPGHFMNLAAAGNDLNFCLTMLAMALPFVWMGVALTLRRLRSVGWSPGLVLLFFIPLINLLFFALLSLAPGHAASAPADVKMNRWTRYIPYSTWGSAAMSMLVTVAVGLGATCLSVDLFRDYGLGVFVLVPFCCGLLSVLLYGVHHPRRLRECLFVSFIAVVLLGAALLLFAMEGAVCILMAAPLAVPLSLLGGFVGYKIQRGVGGRGGIPPVVRTMGLALPLLLTAEHAGQPVAPLLEVRSAIEIAAPPEQVWPQVVAFTELPAPTEWIFRAGIACPMRAEISGHGVGAVRHCIFSTGAFEEPIEVWDEPRLLRFGVTSNPPPMEEWTPYAHVHPPHLDGYLVSERGQFRLIALANGRTRLEGTTWYRHHLWPVDYWQTWSDYIIHRIHLRVLENIKQQVEQGNHAQDNGWSGDVSR